MSELRICCISDTHGLHGEVGHIPDCDLLIHAGDCTNDIGQASLRHFLNWFEKCSPVPKVLIAGNHDGAFERWHKQATELVKMIAPSVTYLEDDSFEFKGFLIHGSPVTPTFYDWHFNRDRGAAIKPHWDKIPEGTDILVTHGPPKGILDYNAQDKFHCGCEELMTAVERIKPKVHIFGHIHSGYGSIEKGGTTFINASLLSERYKMVNKPMVFHVRKDTNDHKEIAG
jgi:Icc-related predicted phosphoesterase